MKKQMQKGFSLVELMVVIAIIAILAAVAIPMYSNYTTRARLGTALAAAGTLKTEIAQENTANADGAVAGVTVRDMPVSAANGYSYTPSVAANGVISLLFTTPVAGTITLTPTVASSGTTINWACASADIPDNVMPGDCQGS